MFDRDKAPPLPKNQLGFLQFVPGLPTLASEEKWGATWENFWVIFGPILGLLVPFFWGNDF